MTETAFRQIFGPSARHDRASVEMRFAPEAGQYVLARLAPLLAQNGLRAFTGLPEEPLPLEAAVCRLAHALLSRDGPPWSRYGREPDHAWVAIGYPYPELAARVMRAARALLLAAGEPASAPDLRPLARRLARVNGVATQMMLAAEAMGGDAVVIEPATGAYQLGHGARGLHCFELGNQRDSLTGLVFARNKRTTIAMLRRLGLPTTRATTVSSVEQAITEARRIGLPCVVKPMSMGKGKGVVTGLVSDQQIAAATEQALNLSRRAVLLENHVAGHDHRLAVVGGELLWAYRRLPAYVTGDGAATLAQLIARENDRRAAIRDGAEAYLCPIATGEALQGFVRQRYGLSVDDVPENGRRIELAGLANIARGGVLEDVTSRVHPDIRALAIRVARLFRMEALGIDFIAPDISRSWTDGDSAIIEINGTPGLSGPGDAALAYRMLMPNRRSGRVPTIAVVGEADYRDRLAERLAAAAVRHGLKLATAEYANAPSEPRLRELAGAPELDAALLDPETEAIAVLCDPAQVERLGFPLSRCDLLAIEDPARFPWLADSATTVREGDVSSERLAADVEGLARTYSEPGEGGPLPVLEPEPEDEASDAFRLKVWRARAMPRQWFWDKVGVERDETTGLTGFADLLDAVRALSGSRAQFAFDESAGAWSRPFVEASIALPQANPGEARAALLAAVERVNAIATHPID